MTEAVFATKCQWDRVRCDTIGFSDRPDFHSIRDPRSPSTRLENKASKSQLLTLRPYTMYISCIECFMSINRQKNGWNTRSTKLINFKSLTSNDLGQTHWIMKKIVFHQIYLYIYLVIVSKHNLFYF